jgi:hypothetical protein
MEISEMWIQSNYEEKGKNVDLRVDECVRFIERLSGKCGKIVEIFGYLTYFGFEILEQESSTLTQPDSRKMFRNF